MTKPNKSDLNILLVDDRPEIVRLLLRHLDKAGRNEFLSKPMEPDFEEKLNNILENSFYAA